MGGGAAAAVGVPSLAALMTPVFKDTVVGADGFVPVAELTQLPEATPVKVIVVVPEPHDAWNKLPPTEVGAIFLTRVAPDRVQAFSTVCPHLGCGVEYRSDRATFVCPCHDSAFALDGAVSTGPSPRPLDELKTRIVGGRVEVRYEAFRVGTAEKIGV